MPESRVVEVVFTRDLVDAIGDSHHGTGDDSTDSGDTDGDKGSGDLYGGLGRSPGKITVILSKVFVLVVNSSKANKNTDHSTQKARNSVQIRDTGDILNSVLGEPR